MYLIAGKYNHLNPEGTFVCCLIKSHFSQRKIVHPIAVLLQAMRLLFSLTYVKIKNYFFRLLSQRREPKDSNFNKLASIGDKLSFIHQECPKKQKLHRVYTHCNTKVSHSSTSCCQFQIFHLIVPTTIKHLIHL